MAGWDFQSRMDYYKKYQEIIADYNKDKDRISIEETFAHLMDFMKSLDDEQRRAEKEGLTEEDLALFDLFQKTRPSQKDRECLKLASIRTSVTAATVDPYAGSLHRERIHTGRGANLHHRLPLRKPSLVPTKKACRLLMASL